MQSAAAETFPQLKIYSSAAAETFPQLKIYSSAAAACIFQLKICKSAAADARSRQQRDIPAAADARSRQQRDIPDTSARHRHAAQAFPLRAALVACVRDGSRVRDDRQMASGKEHRTPFLYDTQFIFFF
jgi:hypothetical protein